MLNVGCVWQAGPSVQILAKVKARPCTAAQATVEGVYEQQQRDNTGETLACAFVFGCGCT
jgi:hypothetical protein